jgi:hypothetical protein
MSRARLIEGKLTPMTEVQGFWSAAIERGVKALGFTMGEVAGAPWMRAEIAREHAPSAVRLAAAAAIAVDKEIAYQTRTTPASQARTSLMLRLGKSSAAVELQNYQRLLTVAVLQRVAADPARLLEALAEMQE